MKLSKRNAILVLLGFGLASSAFAGTKPEWKPFDLGLSKSFHVPLPPPPGAMPTVEITLLGGFMSGFGAQTGENAAADLATGRWSPWFGKGYADFNWISPPGYPAPSNQLATVAGPMLTKDAGALAGVKLGFNVSPMFQIELYFQYQFAGFSIDKASWDALENAELLSDELLTHFFGTGGTVNNSIQKQGKAYMAGLNVNINFLTSGPVRPFLSIGGGIAGFSNLPEISWERHHLTVTYAMDITYKAKTAILIGGGGGIKFFLGPNYGLKLEGRINMIMASFDKILDTDFSSSGSWTVYTPYSGTILTEKGSPITAGGTIGFFFGF